MQHSLWRKVLLCRAASVVRHNFSGFKCFPITPTPRITCCLSTNVNIKPECVGCGVRLQAADSSKVGFYRVPKHVQEQTHNSQEPVGLVCVRCYQAKHYGKLTPVTIAPEKFDEYFSKINSMPCVVVTVVDIFDFHGSVFRTLGSKACGKPTIVAVNKCDLLPKKVSAERVERWVRTELKKLGLRSVVDVVLVSSKTGFGIRDLLMSIQKHRHHKDVYVIGAANAGKSSLINALMAKRWRVNQTKPAPASDPVVQNIGLEYLPPGYQEGDVYLGDIDELRREHARVTDLADVRSHAGESSEEDDCADEGTQLSKSAQAAVSSALTVEKVFVVGADAEVQEALKETRNPLRDTIPLTTSAIPGTTLGLLSMPLSRDGQERMFDTPGVVLNPEKQELFERLASSTPSGMHKVFPGKRSKPMTFRINAGRSLFLGGLARIDFRSSSASTALLCTWFGALEPHLTATIRADDVFQRHKGKLLAPYFSELSEAYSFDLQECVADALTTNVSLHRATRKRRERHRRAVVDIVFQGLGWCSITPIDVEGMPQWRQAIIESAFTIFTCSGLHVHTRSPLLPFETSGMKSTEWKS